MLAALCRHSRYHEFTLLLTLAIAVHGWPPVLQRFIALLLQTSTSVPREVRQPTTAAASPADLDADVLIELHNVHKSFGKKQILRGTNIKVRRGEAVGIIGGSGTGKSTTLRLMAGLLMPDKVQVSGRKLPPMAGCSCQTSHRCWADARYNANALLQIWAGHLAPSFFCSLWQLL